MPKTNSLSFPYFEHYCLGLHKKLNTTVEHMQLQETQMSGSTGQCNETVNSNSSELLPKGSRALTCCKRRDEKVRTCFLLFFKLLWSSFLLFFKPLWSTSSYSIKNHGDMKHPTIDSHEQLFEIFLRNKSARTMNCNWMESKTPPKRIK